MRKHARTFITLAVALFLGLVTAQEALNIAQPAPVAESVQNSKKQEALQNIV